MIRKYPDGDYITIPKCPECGGYVEELSNRCRECGWYDYEELEAIQEEMDEYARDWHNQTESLRRGF